MSKRRKPAKRPGASAHATSGAWGSVALVLVSMLAGCQHGAKTHSGDPLFGEYYPKGANGQPMPTPPPGPKTSAVGVPPYPAANSAGSTAAIAANTDLGLPGGRNLAINEKAGPNWTLTNNSGNGAAPALPPGGRAPIVQPIPRDATAPVVAPGPASTTPANAAGTILKTGSWSTTSDGPRQATTAALPLDPSSDALQKSLEAKGAFGVTKEAVPDGVRVSCYMPSRTGTSKVRYLETVAPDAAAGLHAILQQIEPGN